MEPDPSVGAAPIVPVPVVQIDHLTKRLRSGVTAVDDLSLTVDQGQILGLVGPNGSGKTITLKVLLGLVRPTSGRVSLFGEQIGPGAKVLGRVGALVDGPGFVPHLSGRQNLDLACRQIRLAGGPADLDAAIESTGLGSAIDRRFSDYSHGMRYRLAIAQALLGRPDLLLLDEPTTGMDPAQSHEVRAAIAERASAGATVVISSHQLSEIEVVCTHATIMRQGRLVASGSVPDLVGTLPLVRVDVDDAARGVVVLGAMPGVTRAVQAGPTAVVVEGRSLRPVDLVDSLHAAGLTVTGFRSRTFEDSYLALFEEPVGSLHRSADLEP
jgi:ABC-2 type transport system ATP-binding protein